MPLLTISTNTEITDPEQFALEASAFTARLLSKPESYVMVKLEPVQALSFAGNMEPAALIQLKSLGLAEAQTTSFSDALCTFIESRLGINSARIYIEFSSPERSMWGWDKRTFA